MRCTSAARQVVSVANPEKSFKVAVIGCGGIANEHLPFLASSSRVHLVGVCDTAKATARFAQARFGAEGCYFDANEMLQSARPDVVHVLTPPQSHGALVSMCLKAGAHVICEKPLGMNSKETALVVEAVRKGSKKGPVFAVNYVCRFFPAILQMRAMVARGDLGQIIHVQGHFFQDWLLHETDYNWRVLASEGGKLRAVGDIGTHWIDAVSFVLGAKATDVFAHIETFHKTRKRPKSEVQTFSKADPKALIDYKVDTEDFGSVLLKFYEHHSVDAALHDRVYHWEEHDPEDHSGEPKPSHAVGLLDADGTFWHYWCAPLEGRGLFGFVRDDEFGSSDQRTRDGDALALTARELVRKFVEVGLAQADSLERLGHAFALFGARGRVWRCQRRQRLGHDAGNGLARVQRAEWVLKDHLEVAPRRTQRVAIQGMEVPSFERDVAAGWRVQCHHASRERGLAGAGFPYDAEAATGVHAQADAPQGLQDPARPEQALAWQDEVFDEVFDVEQGLGVIHAAASRRTQRAW